MYDVIMKCPTTQREAPLGLEVKSEEDWDSTTFTSSRYECLACGQNHLVDKQFARLEPRDDDPAAEPASG